MKTRSANRSAAKRPAAIAMLGSVTLAVLLVACQDGDRPAPTEVSPTGPQLTLGSGSQPTLLGRAAFEGPFKVKRKTGDWEVDIHAKDPLDVAVQTLTFQPGGYSGWHSHPGPVFVQVTSGTMTFYESDDPACAPIVRTVGQGYLEPGDHAHIARNQSGTTATVLVVYLAPPGAALRIDEPNPGNCPF